jgi:hypothetical protein
MRISVPSNDEDATHQVTQCTKRGERAQCATVSSWDTEHAIFHGAPWLQRRAVTSGAAFRRCHAVALAAPQSPTSQPLTAFSTCTLMTRC